MTHYPNALILALQSIGIGSMQYPGMTFGASLTGKAPMKIFIGSKSFSFLQQKTHFKRVALL
jgi:hypothetical protein